MSTHSTVSRRRRAIARNATRQLREHQQNEDTDSGIQQAPRDTSDHLIHSTVAMTDASDAPPVPEPPLAAGTHAYETVAQQPPIGSMKMSEPETRNMPEQRRQLTPRDPTFDTLATEDADATLPPRAGRALADGYDEIDHRRQAMAAYQAHVAASSRHGTAGYSRDGLRTGSPFSWRERDWRSSRWSYWLRLLPAAAALVVVLLVAGTLAYILATKAASAADTRLTSAAPPTVRTPGAGLIVQPAPASTTPTPQDVAYRLGIWVSNNTVFVRATHEVAPVPGLPVTITINGFPYGPAQTDADGLARFDVSFGSASETNPAFITAACTVGGQSLTATIDYIPTAGAPVPPPETPAAGTSPVATPPVTKRP